MGATGPKKVLKRGSPLASPLTGARGHNRAERVRCNEAEGHAALNRVSFRRHGQMLCGIPHAFLMEFRVDVFLVHVFPTQSAVVCFMGFNPVIP